MWRFNNFKTKSQADVYHSKYRFQCFSLFVIICIGCTNNLSLQRKRKTVAGKIESILIFVQLTMNNNIHAWRRFRFTKVNNVGEKSKRMNSLSFKLIIYTIYISLHSGVFDDMSQ